MMPENTFATAKDTFTRAIYESEFAVTRVFSCRRKTTISVSSAFLKAGQIKGLRRCKIGRLNLTCKLTLTWNF
jgi:hypothetical protein